MPEWVYEAGIGEARAALIEDDRIVEAAIELPNTLRLGTVAKAQLVELTAGGMGRLSIAGDTTIALGRMLLPPAETEAIQRDLLLRLSGRRHHALSAICVIGPDGTQRTRLSDTIVAFRPLSPAEIDAYIACGEGLGKAGGYAIQGRAEAFVRGDRT